MGSTVWGRVGYQFAETEAKGVAPVDLTAAARHDLKTSMRHFALPCVGLLAFREDERVLMGRAKFGSKVYPIYEISFGSTYEFACEQAFSRLLGSHLPFDVARLQALNVPPVMALYNSSALGSELPHQALIVLLSYAMLEDECNLVRNTPLRTEHRWVAPEDVTEANGYEPFIVQMTRLYMLTL